MPVLTLAPDGRVTHANAAAAKLFEKPPPGHVLAELTRVPGCLQAFDAAGDSGAAQTVQCRLPAEDGALHQVSVHPFDRDAGAPPRRVMICQGLADSTPRETARTTFLANAGHEFRTPLTAILGMVETLRGPGRDDPEVQELYLDRLGKQASRMVTLVDDMIHLSAVEMSEALPPEGRVDLVPLAREVAEDLAWQAAVRSMHVKVEVPGDPVTVTGDAEQLRQLLTNLLGNAIKHGNEDGHIGVEVGKTPPRITVTDDGEGIPPERNGPRVRALLPVGPGPQSADPRPRPGASDREARRPSARRRPGGAQRARRRLCHQRDVRWRGAGAATGVTVT